MVFKGFMIDLPEHLILVLHGILWNLRNRQAAQGGSFLTLMRLLGIVPFLGNISRDLKEQWFRLWCQNRTPLSSCTQMSSVDHSLSISSLVK